MKLEIGKTYVNGSGSVRKIQGLAKTKPINDQPVYYSSCGCNWYSEDGRVVNFDGKKYYLADIGSQFNLKE